MSVIEFTKDLGITYSFLPVRGMDRRILGFQDLFVAGTAKGLITDAVKPSAKPLWRGRRVPTAERADAPPMV